MSRKNREEGYIYNIDGLINSEDSDAYEPGRDLYIDGVPLSRFNVSVSRQHLWDIAERDMEAIEVPGRNGAVLIDHGTYKNIQIPYTASIITDGRYQMRALQKHLFSDFGYRKIFDPIDSTHFRRGRIVTPFRPEMMTARDYDAANFELVFDCKPQRFLTDGDIWIPVPLLYGTNSNYMNTLIIGPGRNVEEDSAFYEDAKALTIRIEAIDSHDAIVKVMCWRQDGSEYNDTIRSEGGDPAKKTYILAESLSSGYKQIQAKAYRDIGSGEIEARHWETDLYSTLTITKAPDDGQEVTERYAGIRIGPNFIVNPTDHISKPAISFWTTASGTDVIDIQHEDDGSTDTVRIKDQYWSARRIYIDAETQAKTDSYIQISGKWPTLHPGKNKITIFNTDQTSYYQETTEVLARAQEAGLLVKTNFWEV